MSNLPKLKPFLEDMLSMSTGHDGHTLQIHYSRPVTKEDRQAFLDAHNAAVGEAQPAPADRSEPIGYISEHAAKRLKNGAGFSLMVSKNIIGHFVVPISFTPIATATSEGEE